MKEIRDMTNFNEMYNKATYIAHSDDNLITYYFDEEKREIGFHPTGIPERTLLLNNRLWSSESLEHLTCWTKIKF